MPIAVDDFPLNHEARPWACLVVPEIDFMDDKEGKPVAIHRSIGRQPIAVFDNRFSSRPSIRVFQAENGRVRNPSDDQERF